MSRPPHQVTEQSKAEVRALKSFGHTNEDIAKYLDISADTLTKYYKRDLETGLIHAIVAVAGALFKKAVEDGDVRAMIFWLKTRAGWRTEDSKQKQESNEVVRREIKELRANLDAQNRKDY